MLWYIDYECNKYMEEWSFENWGVKYWSRTPEFEEYLRNHSNYRRLQFSAPVKAEQKQNADNPKRRQRNARKQMEASGIGTKSQQALQKQYEENKTERKRTTREQREAEKQRQFELKQQKRKEKHRGH